MSKLSHNKVATREEVVAHFRSGMTMLAGGFGPAGYPTMLYEWLHATDCTDLHIITSGVAPADKPFQLGFAALLNEHRISSLTLTHAANNPEVGNHRNQGTLAVEAVPQGTFVERIRAGGCGLGGVLTPTGVGTIVEDNPLCLGKQTINGKDYLLMAPVHADFAVIAGAKIDKAGNVWYKGDTSNFNIVMATAADVVIAEAEEIVEMGDIAPEDVRTSGVFVDYVVEGGKY